MKTKIIGILVVTLLIAATVLPVAETMNVGSVEESTEKNVSSNNSPNSVNTKLTLQQQPNPFWIQSFIVDEDWNYWDNWPDMYAIPNGNVGIGTSNPAAQLHIKGNYGASDGIRVTNLATQIPAVGFFSKDDSRWGICSSTGWGDFDVTQYDSNWNRMPPNGGVRLIIRENGNVGIGTTNPTEKLHVVGDIYCTGKLTSDGGNDPPYVLYNKETRDSIIERVAREVPEDKLDGAVLFWNSDYLRFEVYLPAKGEFRDLQGNLLTENLENSDNNLHQKIADLEARIATLEALIK